MRAPPAGHTVRDRIFGPMLPASTINSLGATAQKWLADYIEVS
jgi:hypothetical protein